MTSDKDEFVLVKKAGTVRVAKTDVDRIERVLPAATQPSTRPAVDVEKKG